MPRRGVRVLVGVAIMAAGIGLWGMLSGAPAKETQPATADPGALPAVLADARLTLEARSVLSHDPKLSALNLGVRVHDGVAVLWGPVPTRELIPYALQKLREVKGLKEIQSELMLLPQGTLPIERPPPRPPPPLPPETDAQKRLPPTPGDLLAGGDRRQPIPGQTLSQPHGPGDVRPASTGPSSGPATIRLLPPTAVPETRAPAPEEPAAVLLPPRPARPRAVPPEPDASAVLLAPRPASAPVDLLAAVRQLQDEQSRFRKIDVVVQDRLIYLRGSGSDLLDLAARVRSLPGVEKVILVANP